MIGQIFLIRLSMEIFRKPSYLAWYGRPFGLICLQKIGLLCYGIKALSLDMLRLLGYSFLIETQRCTVSILGVWTLALLVSSAARLMNLGIIYSLNVITQQKYGPLSVLASIRMSLQLLGMRFYLGWEMFLQTVIVKLPCFKLGRLVFIAYCENAMSGSTQV